MKIAHSAREVMKRIRALPEPIKEPIAEGTVYWFITHMGNTHNYTYLGDSPDKKILKEKNAFYTEEDAKAHADFRRWLLEPAQLTLEECYQKITDNSILVSQQEKAKALIELLKANKLA